MQVSRPQLNIVGVIVLLLLGAILLIWCFSLVTGSDRPTCGGETMDSGDVCLVVDQNGSHTNTYSEQAALQGKSDNSLLEGLTGLAGAVCLGVSLRMIVLHRARVAAYNAAELAARGQQRQDNGPRTSPPQSF